MFRLWDLLTFFSHALLRGCVQKLSVCLSIFNISFNLISEDGWPAACECDLISNSMVLWWAYSRVSTPRPPPPMILCVPTGAERGQRAAVRHSLDCHGDHPLLVLHLQPPQPPAVPHQMGKVGKRGKKTNLTVTYCTSVYLLEDMDQ